jgi:hypothetical protein
MDSCKLTKDGLLEVKFRVYKHYYRSGSTWYDGTPKLKYIIEMRDYPGSYTQIPSSGGSSTYDYDASALFAETMDWDWLNPETASSQTVANPKIRSFVEEDFDYDRAVTAGSPYTSKDIPHTVTFTIDMGWVKSQSTKSVYYVQTAINASTGWESPPSEVSNTVDIKPGSYVRLVGLGVGNYVYRSAAGTEEDAFFYMFKA